MPKDEITSDQVVLFTDVHDFSIVARGLGERTFSFLDQLYQRLGEVAVGNSGTIIKYIGDALLVTFPEGHCQQAVEVGITMRQIYAGLVSDYRVDHDTDLEVGIDVGPVQTGVVGHSSLRTADVFGEVVNRAAVIGHYRGVAITDAVKDQLDGSRRVTRLPDYTVKWQPAPLVAWAVQEG